PPPKWPPPPVWPKAEAEVGARVATPRAATAASARMDLRDMGFSLGAGVGVDFEPLVVARRKTVHEIGTEDFLNQIGPPGDMVRHTTSDRHQTSLAWPHCRSEGVFASSCGRAIDHRQLRRGVPSRGSGGLRRPGMSSSRGATKESWRWPRTR